MKNIIATKANLINFKKSLDLAYKGYDLMEKKNNILLKEMTVLVSKVKNLREKLTSSYKNGYYLLQKANQNLGVISKYAYQVKIDNSIKVKNYSVMGVEIPKVYYEKDTQIPEYSLESSDCNLDEAFVALKKIKELTFELVELDNSIYRLADAIKKTKKRSNALKNIVIPKLEKEIKIISETLEEKEREEFSRLKVIKGKNNE